ncbi:MAG: hypothetical protein M0R80_29155 [Proteobacteria bacterium]|jgi:hypothetical protein|nr:hypothetical protein [Pseudomonadota bacterium]
MSRGPVHDALLAELKEHLGGLREWAQRTNVFTDLVVSISPEDASSLFDLLLGLAFSSRERRLRVASSTARFAVALGEWPPEHLTHTREAAVAQGDRLTDLFLLADVEAEDDDAQLAVPDYGGGRPLTLGERRALALRPSRRTMDLAMRDPHPLVAARLLSNPKLTEADVVRIAARRPAAASVLRRIGLSAKWRARPRVAIALVENPCTPTAIALSLVPDLDRRLVEAIPDDARLDDRLRLAARALLAASEDFRQPFP